MKRAILLILLLISVCSVCHARAIAIEMREDGKFTEGIGRAWVEGDSIEVVMFVKGLTKDNIQPNAVTYKILEKSSVREGVYHIKCRNQFGVVASGTLDMSDYVRPKLTLITDLGIVLTNISKDGLAMKKAYIPNVDLGD